MRKSVVASLAGLLLSAFVAGAQTQINTTTQWDGSRQIGMFGAAPGFTVFGQSFTSPTDNVLNSFSFWLNAGGAPSNILFSAFVMAWDGSKASGPVLWQSGPTSGPTTRMQRYDFNTGALALTPNATYVAFLSSIPYLNQFQSNAQVLMGYSQNPYSGGRFYSMLNVTNFANVTSTAWGTDAGGDYDAAFVANFSTPVTATPEPASIVLLGSGLVSIAGARWRRRRPTA